MSSTFHLAEKHLIKEMDFLRLETLPNVNLKNYKREKNVMCMTVMAKRQACTTATQSPWLEKQS